MITVNTSYTNLVSQHTLTKNTNALQKATERLSTGARINHAKDDAAGVFLDVSLSSQISSMKTANDNTLLATNFLNIANGTLTTVSDCLMRMNDLATQACNGVLSDDARNTLQSEMNALSAQIDQSIAASNMNGVSTIDRSNMSADLMNKVDVRSLDDLKAEGYVACTVANMSSLANTKFYISSVEELQNLAEATNANKKTSERTFTLAADLDLSSVCSAESGVSWTPIGDYANTNGRGFYGTFDGNGHVISNLYIDAPETIDQGLFGYVSGGTVKNLGVENANITGAGKTGGIAGHFYSYSLIENCYSTGSVNATGGADGARGNTGGLLGYVSVATSIKDCYSTATVTAQTTTGGLTGGLAGYIYDSCSVENCYATGNVTGSGGSIGGFAGAIGPCTVKNCYATGKVKGINNEYTGGFAGSTNSATLKNIYATGDVEGKKYVGGLIGEMINSRDTVSLLENSYSTGRVTGTNRAGGLVGYMEKSTVKSCYSTSSVICTNFGIGGLVGEAKTSSAIMNSYATGYVKGSENIGGLVGQLTGSSTVSSCYSTGNTKGTKSVGGFLGHINTGSSVSNCYSTGNAEGPNDSTGCFAGRESESIITNSYATGTANGTAADPADKENFDKSVLDGSLWNLSGDNPTLKSSIWSDCGKIETNRVSVRMQVGDTADENSAIAYDSYFRLNLDDLDLSTVESARKALAKLQSNITDVTAKQSYIGTQINRLSDIYNSQQIRIENTSAAKSTISDTDYAKEVANMVKSQILQQISVSVLTQSQNISGKIALSLL